MSEITIRYASATDIDVLVHHRVQMFAEMEWGHAESRERMAQAFPAWVLPKLESGEFWTILACDGDRVVAGAGLWEMDWPPGPTDTALPRAYVYNVYVEPDYRRQGLARRLMNIALDDCRQRGIKSVGLHASDFARSLYESLGFQATPEMQLVLG